MLIRFRGKAVVVSTHCLINHCNGFRDFRFTSQYLYSSTSTPAPTHFLVKYLVDSLGFSDEEAASTSSKVTSLKNLKNPHLVINFLKQIGLDDTQMKKMVSLAPKMLLSDVSKTLKPKFQCLMDIGLSGSDLVDVIAKDSKIVERGLDTHLRPTIDCLRRTLGSDENVVKALKRAPWLLTFGLSNSRVFICFPFGNSSCSDYELFANQSILLPPELLYFLVLNVKLKSLFHFILFTRNNLALHLFYNYSVM
uniref:Uncharacterized protein n=1 Tax=Solanum lycopersicum TaxID=4081 RepID=K4BTP0_SOLLC